MSVQSSIKPFRRASYRVGWADEIRSQRSLTTLEAYKEHCDYLRNEELSEALRIVKSWNLKPYFAHFPYRRSDVTYARIVIERIVQMARGKSNKQNTQKSNSQYNVEFVTIRLTDEDKSLLAEQELMTSDEFFELVETLTVAQYKISVSMQANGSVNFTATARDEANVNYGLALSGWGDSLITAAMSFKAKHDKSGGGWKSASDSGGSTPRFG